MNADKPKRTRPLLTSRSISRDLTFSLVVIVMIIATALGGYIYWQQTQEMRESAEEKGEDTITSVAEILAVPIWNLDYDNARLIGQWVPTVATWVPSRSTINDQKSSIINKQNRF